MTKLTTIGSSVLAMVPALTVAASMELMAFSNKAVCEQVVRSLATQSGANAELWKTVEWVPVTLKGEGPSTRRCSSLDQTHMDLNNDGQEDLVVKATFCPKGVPSDSLDSLYVFSVDSTVLEQASWQDLSPLLATHDKFERTGGSYPLTALSIDNGLVPPPLTTSFSLRPFLLNGTAYVSLTDVRREWMVIARYQGGDRFEDLCYVQAGRV